MPLYGPSLDTDKPVKLINLLEAGLKAYPDEIALVSTKNSWTWRQLDKASDRYAAHLHALGIRKGDRVASLMPNRDALVIHYLGCIKGGFVAVPLNYRYMPPEIDHAMGLTKPKVLLAHVERDADLAAAEEAARLPFGVIRYGAGEGDGSFEAMLIKEAPEVAFETPEPNDPVFIFFTSGSTGKPKGVTHTHETFGWILTACAKGYEVKPEDVMLAASSMSHIGGQVHSLTALSVGAKAMVARTFDPDELLWLLRAHRPTLLWMLPSALIGLVREHGASHGDFASLRLCVSGGDKVTAQLEREFTGMVGFAVNEIYGMSEIGTSNINPVSGENRLGSVGPANYGYALSILDDDGNELGGGEQGRLWVKSSANMVGYWHNPAATEETIVDGWLDTGDVMRADEDGYLWFCGRKKQIIVHDASNISPQEVEESLIAHPAVLHAGVVGVHDLIHGENVWAYVTLSEDVQQRPLAQELVEFSRARVGYKAPEVIVFVDEMPMNATGKVDRVRLKQWAAERHDAEVAAD